MRREHFDDCVLAIVVCVKVGAPPVVVFQEIEQLLEAIFVRRARHRSGKHRLRKINAIGFVRFNYWAKRARHDQEAPDQWPSVFRYPAFAMQQQPNATPSQGHDFVVGLTDKPAIPEGPFAVSQNLVCAFCC
jgi:hypothetical protein